jgi:IS30 family transposase
LSDTERGELYAYAKMGLSFTEIGVKMKRHKSIISREHKRGSVQQINTNRKAFSAYFPDSGARVYRENRSNCGAPSVVMKAWSFLRFAETKILKDNWSPDAVVGMAKRSPEWKNSFIPCTKTIYKLIDTGALSVINMDLALKVKRSTKKKRPRENKRIMGPSIGTRCPSVETREEFGHWEIDTVIGKKSNDEALLTLIERKTRKELIVRLAGKDAGSVELGLKKLFDPYDGQLSHVFKTNGSEFSTLEECGKKGGFSVYFSHPYSSFERGTNERHNGLIRRVIKKGQPIYSYSDALIQEVETWMNELPRKILGYETPSETTETPRHSITMGCCI